MIAVSELERARYNEIYQKTFGICPITHLSYDSIEWEVYKLFDLVGQNFKIYYAIEQDVAQFVLMRMLLCLSF